MTNTKTNTATPANTRTEAKATLLKLKKDDLAEHLLDINDRFIALEDKLKDMEAKGVARELAQFDRQQLGNLTLKKMQSLLTLSETSIRKAKRTLIKSRYWSNLLKVLNLLNTSMRNLNAGIHWVNVNVT